MRCNIIAFFLFSLKEGVCIDEEVFFGPITDKERKIREQFENPCTHENKTVESCSVDIDVSKNDSIYKSFSVEDTKYDSFDDSLIEENDKMPQEKMHITLRKSYDKIKAKRSGFYDSLEDVCSLTSNIDKCSISCDVENDSNFNNKQLIVEDSLKNPPIAIVNKSHVISDQVLFDDDSLAILECENTFDDSLEEVNMMESIEVEDLGDIEIVENQIISVKVDVDQNSSFITRNLFDTSIDIFCDKKNIVADPEESSLEKNQLFDSLSNSDFKDLLLKDSLEESEKANEILNLMKNTTIDVMVSNEIVVIPNENVNLKVEHCSIPAIKNHFEAPIQIDIDNKKVSDAIDQEELSEDKNLQDSLSYSDFKDVLKDSLEESEISAKNYVSKPIADDNIKPVIVANQNMLDSSVQIIYENSCNHSQNENISEKTNSECNDISKDSLENSKNTQKYSVKPTKENLVAENEGAVYNIDQNTCIQIALGRKKGNDIADKDLSDQLNLLNTSATTSSCKDISKDSLEKSYNSSKNEVLKQVTINDISDKDLSNRENLLNIPANTSCEDISKDSLEKLDHSNRNEVLKQVADSEEAENVFANQNVLDSSVQIVYEKHSQNENVIEKTNSEYIDYSKDSLENSNSLKDSVHLMTTNKQALQLSKVNPLVNKDACISQKPVDDSSVYSDVNRNMATNTNIPGVIKEAICVESCHLKLLNDNISINKDLKFQLHLEVTVGDKKCEIKSQDIKVVPMTSQNSKSETDSCPALDKNSKHCTEDIEEKTVSYFSTQEQIIKIEDHNKSKKRVSLGADSCKKESGLEEKYSPVTTDRKKSLSFTAVESHSPRSMKDVSLLQALDLHDISVSFLNDSIIQSEDPLLPLNLWSRDQNLQSLPIYQNDNKENMPQQSHAFSNKNITPSKLHMLKSPQSFQKCISSKKIIGTKIPVRKIENFAVPVATPNKHAKIVPTSLSAEKYKKCQHSPHATDAGKKLPGATPNKAPHICKVRNTIFSKVPQIVTPKKYMNIQSPVAQVRIFI